MISFLREISSFDNSSDLLRLSKACRISELTLSASNAVSTRYIMLIIFWRGDNFCPAITYPPYLNGYRNKPPISGLPCQQAKVTV
jgi:hypothetical protein